MEDDGKLCYHLMYFMTSLYILLPFGRFYGYSAWFSTFWYVVPNLATLDSVLVMKLYTNM
jgi:hypothetical protein